ncbi:MAG: hypothetical protein JXX14_17870 [Deltaproteobacteria bacterium]|nr:hypothetical protein [Deltaproteobacteria bacterium]
MILPHPEDSDPGTQQQKAAAMLTAATALEGTLHLPGVRNRYRRQLEETISLATSALALTNNRLEVSKIRWLLLRAHAALAADARYGAGQLSRGSQRAPTLADCDDGWQRVEAIVTHGENAAKEVARLATELGTAEADAIAVKTREMARGARNLVTERNRAYTFHTDPGFSFGEGWYLAAAALFAGLSIQIKPGTAHEIQAKRFLHDAGLGTAIVPYRSRPASPKHLTDIIANAFGRNPQGAQKILREAFLGSKPPDLSLTRWIEENVGASPDKKVLLWIRTGDHDAERNTCFRELRHISDVVLEKGLIPIFFGDAIPPGIIPKSGVDLTLRWKDPLFQGPTMRRQQLQLFEALRYRHGLIGQIGVTTAGMDGPALLGLPTLYLTQRRNVRLGKWVGTVPGYQELVRRPGYLDVIRETASQWLTQPVTHPNRCCADKTDDPPKREHW